MVDKEETLELKGEIKDRLSQCKTVEEEVSVLSEYECDGDRDGEDISIRKNDFMSKIDQI